jgi:hypothetical protein
MELNQSPDAETTVFVALSKDSETRKFSVYKISQNLGELAVPGELLHFLNPRHLFSEHADSELAIQPFEREMLDIPESTPDSGAYHMTEVDIGGAIELAREFLFSSGGFGLLNIADAEMENPTVRKFISHLKDFGMPELADNVDEQDGSFPGFYI